MQTPRLSGLRSATSPERRALWPALFVALIGMTSAWACSNSAHAVRLPALQADEEIYRITCDKSIEPCREKARELCAGVYQVLETAGAPIKPPRITTAPGPASTGPRYQRMKWVGRMVIACGDAAPTPRSALEHSGNREPSTATDAPRPALAPGQVCIPGATQECLGAGACRGAQACLMDGRGYGPCDCGTNDEAPRQERVPADAGPSQPPLTR